MKDEILEPSQQGTRSNEVSDWTRFHTDLNQLFPIIYQKLSIIMPLKDHSLVMVKGLV